MNKVAMYQRAHIVCLRGNHKDAIGIGSKDKARWYSAYYCLMRARSRHARAVIAAGCLHRGHRPVAIWYGIYLQLWNAVYY